MEEPAVYLQDRGDEQDRNDRHLAAAWGLVRRRGLPGRQMLGLLRDPFAALPRLMQEKGDLAFTRMGLQPVVVVGHPDGIREVLGTRAPSFTKGDSLQGLRVLLGDGLITSDGEQHARQRRLLQPLFSVGQRSSWTPAIVASAEYATARWSDGEIRDAEEDMLGLSLLVASQVLFSTDPGGDVAELSAAMHTLDDLSYLTALPGLPWAVRSPLPSMVRFRAARAVLQQAVERMIRTRLADPSPPDDVLSAVLFSARADRDLPTARDQVVTLWVAAYVTTGHALAWALHCLSRNPAAQAALADEANEVFGGRLPSGSDVGRLTWSRAAFAESLRLFPPAWILGRQAEGDAAIGGTPIRKGTLVMMSPWVTHRDDRWHPAPLHFEPGRWLGRHPVPRPFSYVPFGAGLRRCIGEPLAWLEGTLVLAVLASRWSFHPVREAEPTFRTGISLASRDGLPLRIQRRDAHS